MHDKLWQRIQTLKEKQSTQEPLDIHRDCFAGQGAIWGSHCLFLLTKARVTYITYDMCIMHFSRWILTDTI